MKFTRKLSAIALALLTAGGVSSIANAQCNPLPGTTIGDPNGDGVRANVQDVVALVNTAFRGQPNSRYLGSDDINGDAVINVQDVVGIVNIAFRGAVPTTPFRVYPLTGRSGLGTYTLIADDSIQYRVFGVYNIASDTLTSLLPPPSSCPKTDTIRIQAGTDIEGDTSQATPSAFIVRRYGYIHSVGTETDPIVFTSMLAPGLRDRGNWGGLVLNGCDSCNEPSGQFTSEGNGGIGGGFASGDNSGCVIYTRQEFSGRVFALNNELNGMTLNGVGRGTTIHHVQINQNADDGIEWFGGTVDVKYAVVSGCDDDKFDTDLGSNFRAQFLIGVEDTLKGTASTNHQGLEWDNRPAAPFNLTPVNNPVVANVTLIGQGYDFNPGGVSHHSVHFRRGTAGKVYNALFTRWRRAVDVDDASTTTVENSIWYDVNAYNQDGDGQGNAFVVDPVLGGPFGGPYAAPYNYLEAPNAGATALANILTASGYTDAGFPDFRPLAGSLPVTWLTTSGSTIVLPADGFFDAAGNGFVGAVNTGDPDPWYEGWTSFVRF